MLLAFDVGNTNIVCGIYRGKELLNHWRLATDTLQTADGYASVLGTLFRINGLQFPILKMSLFQQWYRRLFLSLNLFRAVISA